MKKDHVLEQGFTLIEIIIVLVLLGILAATAVPKYFDLQKVAQARAAQSAVAELQAQVNMTFANELMKGGDCTNVALVEAKKLASGTGGKVTSVTGWTINVAQETGVVSAVTKTKDLDGAPEFTADFNVLTGYTPKIVFPVCDTTTETK